MAIANLQCSDTQFPNCYTMTVYASYPSASESWLVRGCATNWKAFTIYREIVTATSKTSATSTPTTGPSVPNAGPSATGTGSRSEAAATDTPAATASTSQAWIAGAVIGPVVALAGLGFLAFWLGMRKAKNKNAPEGTPSMMPPPGPPMTDRGSYHPSYHYGGGSPVGSNVTPFANVHQDPAMMSTPSPPTVPGYPQSANGSYSPNQYQSPQQYAASQFSAKSPPPQFQAPYGGPEIQHSQFRDPYTAELDSSVAPAPAPQPPQPGQYPTNMPELDSSQVRH